MKKLVLIGSVALVVIIIVLVIVGISNLGPLIKNAVNTYGPKLTKTEVSIRDVDISLFSAEAKLKDLLLGNPEGFKSPHAMKVGSIFVNVDEGSLTGETLIIDRIEVIEPDISYEKISGTDNFQVILGNVKSLVGTEEPSPQKIEKEGTEKKIMIRDFVVKDGKVNLTMSMLGGKTISAPLPDIQLKNIGQEQGGTSAANAFKSIFTELYAKITSPDVTTALNSQLKAIGASIEATTEKAKKQLETMEKDLKGQAEKAIGDNMQELLGK